jgi:nitroreductase
MDVSEAVQTRRARRVLSERGIEDDEVRALAEAARLSASCFNNQPWRLVFCRGGDALGAVKAALSKGNVWATRAPLIVAVAARPPDDCQLSDRRDYFLFDCGLAIGQLELMATGLGLIAHPIAGYDPLKVKAALGIPEEHTVITLVICGHPGDDDSLLSDKQKEAERSRPERKPLGETVFLDRWGSPMA